MSQKEPSFSLKNYNTFGLDYGCNQLIYLKDIRDFNKISDPTQAFFIGGGSNILLTDHIQREVVINQLKGIEIRELDSGQVELEVSSGENWHELVMFAVEKGLGGIENLSLIPGSVGAAPMQNIGAYGVEIKDVLSFVEAIELSSGQSRRFSPEECEFGYRESIFKRRFKGQFFISKVGFILKREPHELNTSYGDIEQWLQAAGISEPGIADVSNAVIAIRKSKLPDPNQLGNAGSFFKNPIIAVDYFQRLQKQFPSIRSYPVSETEVKIPAGWLIESLGWKGKRFGQCGSHEKQALVLVNYGGASGSEILDLSENIQADVWDHYKIKLETEVNIIQ